MTSVNIVRVEAIGRFAGVTEMRKIDVTARDHRTIGHLLGLDKQALDKLRGERVLCLGEGGSNFAKQIEKVHGGRVVAVDPAYSDRALVRRHRGNLATLRVAGDAAQLSFEPGTARLVTAPYLLSWWSDMTKRISVASSALSMLAPGGQFRFNLWQATLPPEGPKRGVDDSADSARLLVDYARGTARFSQWLRSSYAGWEIRERALEGVWTVHRNQFHLTHFGDPAMVGELFVRGRGMTRFDVRRPMAPP